MISYLKISGFKSVKETELDLLPVNILIGSNGSGKSNIISFFKLVHALFNQRLQRFVVEEKTDNLLHFGRKNTEKLYGKLIFTEQKDNNAYWFKLAQTKTGGLFIEKESAGYNVKLEDDDWNYFNFYDREESKIPDLDGYRYKYLRNYLSNIQIYHFHDTSSTSFLRKECDINDDAFLKSDGRNLPAFLYSLQVDEPIILKRIVKTIQSVAPYIDHFILEPSRQNKNEIELRWVDTGDLNTNFSAYQLSDGTLRFIALTTVLMQPNPPGVIIIDEPELGLHPFAITKLAGMINSIADKGTQVIIATQSADLVNHFDAENIITVDQENGASKFKRLVQEELSEWLNDYSVGDLWQRNILQGGQPK